MVGSFACVSTEWQGLPEELVDAGGFQAQARFLAAGQRRLQFLTSVGVILLLDQRFRKVHGTASCKILEVQRAHLGQEMQLVSEKNDRKESDAVEAFNFANSRLTWVPDPLPLPDKKAHIPTSSERSTGRIS